MVTMSTVPLMMDIKGGDNDDFAYHNNVAGAALHIRMGFIRKVYSLLSMQLCLQAFYLYILQTLRLSRNLILFGLRTKRKYTLSMLIS